MRINYPVFHLLMAPVLAFVLANSLVQAFLFHVTLYDPVLLIKVNATGLLALYVGYLLLFKKVRSHGILGITILAFLLIALLFAPLNLWLWGGCLGVVTTVGRSLLFGRVLVDWLKDGLAVFFALSLFWFLYPVSIYASVLSWLLIIVMMDLSLGEKQEQADRDVFSENLKVAETLLR